MSSEDLEKKIAATYRRHRERQEKLAPNFEELLNAKSKPSRHWPLPEFFKMAAAIALLLSASYIIFLSINQYSITTNSKDILISDHLLLEPEYIWNWKAPSDEWFPINTSKK